MPDPTEDIFKKDFSEVAKSQEGSVDFLHSAPKVDVTDSVDVSSGTNKLEDQAKIDTGIGRKEDQIEINRADIKPEKAGEQKEEEQKRLNELNEFRAQWLKAKEIDKALKRGLVKGWDVSAYKYTGEDGKEITGLPVIEALEKQRQLLSDKIIDMAQIMLNEEMKERGKSDDRDLRKEAKEAIKDIKSTAKKRDAYRDLLTKTAYKIFNTRRARLEKNTGKKVMLKSKAENKKEILAPTEVAIENPNSTPEPIVAKPENEPVVEKQEESPKTKPEQIAEEPIIEKTEEPEAGLSEKPVQQEGVGDEELKQLLTEKLNLTYEELQESGGFKKGEEIYLDVAGDPYKGKKYKIDKIYRDNSSGIDWVDIIDENGVSYNAKVEQITKAEALPVPVKPVEQRPEKELSLEDKGKMELQKYQKGQKVSLIVNQKGGGAVMYGYEFVGTHETIDENGQQKIMVVLEDGATRIYDHPIERREFPMNEFLEMQKRADDVLRENVRKRDEEKRAAQIKEKEAEVKPKKKWWKFWK